MAFEYYENAIKLEPNNKTLRINIGNVYQSQGLFDMAIKHYESALKVNPDFSVAHYNLGVAYFKSGDKNSALKEYKKLKFPIFLLFVIDIGFDRTAYRWFQEASGDRPKSPHWLTIHRLKDFK
jgi:tetratricopeptide (TPR) repeat protein